jgi:hypothetical protein
MAQTHRSIWIEFSLPICRMIPTSLNTCFELVGMFFIGHIHPNLGGADSRPHISWMSTAESCHSSVMEQGTARMSFGNGLRPRHTVAEVVTTEESRPKKKCVKRRFFRYISRKHTARVAKPDLSAEEESYK